MRIYPGTTVDYEFGTLGGLGHTGSLNDRQFSFLRSTGLTGALADMFGGYTGFSPATLFAASEPGVWYDPSDLTTLFQDSVGTTPVTAAGQPVGLMLDKSQGLVLGAELVTNGDFSDGATGWTLGTGWSISGGTASRDATAVASNLSGGTGVVAGKSYRVTWTQGAGTVAVYLGSAAGPTVANLSAAGTYSRTVLATVSGGILFRANVVVSSIDNVSVRELAGNHATQATAAARPTYQTSGGLHWLAFDGVDDFMVTPTITPGTDKAQLFAGVRKLTETVERMVAEHGVAGSNPLAMSLSVPQIGLAWQLVLRDAVQNAIARTSATFPPPQTAVVTGLLDYAGAALADEAKIRVNQAQTDAGTGGQVAGAFGNYPLYIATRGGASRFFDGHIYGLVVRFGANLTADQIDATEAYMAEKTGVTL